MLGRIAVHRGVEGQAGAGRVGAQREQGAQHVARADLRMGGQRRPAYRGHPACTSGQSQDSPDTAGSAGQPSSSACAQSTSVSAVGCLLGDHQQHFLRVAVGHQHRRLGEAVGDRRPDRADAHHRAAEPPAGRHVTGDAVGHRLEEEQRAEPVAVSDRLPDVLGRDPVAASADQHQTRPLPVTRRLRRLGVVLGQAPVGNRRHQRVERGLHEAGHHRWRAVLGHPPPRLVPDHRLIGSVRALAVEVSVIAQAAFTSSAVFAPPNAEFRLSAYGARQLPRPVGDHVQRAVRIGPEEAGVDAQLALSQRQHRDHQLQQAGGLQRVAVHRLGGADRHPLGHRSERAVQRRCLGGVAEHRPGRVRVDVAELFGIDAAAAQRRRDGSRQPAAVRGRLAGMVGVAGPAPTGQLGDRPMATPGRTAGRLQHHRCHRVAQQQALPVPAERPSHPVGGQRLACVEQRVLVGLDQVAGGHHRPLQLPPADHRSRGGDRGARRHAGRGVNPADAVQPGRLGQPGCLRGHRGMAVHGQEQRRGGPLRTTQAGLGAGIGHGDRQLHRQARPRPAALPPRSPGGRWCRTG